jgi:protein AATF/BFR2
MAPKRMLADVIGDFLDPTPKDYDPVDAIAEDTLARDTQQHEDREAEDAEDAEEDMQRRPAKSRKLTMRQQMMDDVDEKYKGKKVSRAELYEQPVHNGHKNQLDASDVESDDDDEDNDEIDDEESESGNGSLSDNEEAELNSDEQQEDEEDEDHDEEEEEEGEEESTMVVVSKSSDEAKAEAAHSQHALYSALCGTRIRMQRPFQLIHQILHSNPLHSDPILLSSSASLLKSIHSELKSVQSALMQARGISDESALFEFLDALGDKWSQRTALYSGTSATLDNFKMDFSAQVRQQQAVLRDKKGVFDAEKQVYDDGDWYASFLKGILADGAAADGDAVDAVSGRAMKKAKKEVDRRASKGRKVRYQIIEKLVKFMAPQREADVSEAALHVAQHVFGH